MHVTSNMPTQQDTLSNYWTEPHSTVNDRLDKVNTWNQSCAQVMTAESRVIAFSRGESRVALRVISLESRVISFESESSRVIAKVSRVIIAQLVVST